MPSECVRVTNEDPSIEPRPHAHWSIPTARTRHRDTADAYAAGPYYTPHTQPLEVAYWGCLPTWPDGEPAAKSGFPLEFAAKSHTVAFKELSRCGVVGLLGNLLWTPQSEM